MRRFLLVLFIMVMIPYATTLAWTGRLEGINYRGSKEKFGSLGWSSQKDSAAGAVERKIVIEQDKKEVGLSVEEYLVHVLAAQIPADFEMETLKAQAILARTYIYGLMGNRTDTYEEELDMDALSTGQMKALW